ncbi:MAG: DUF805 domain-containing protein [Actinomycetota bacterium]
MDLFTGQGRVGRLAYFLTSVAICIVFGVIVVATAGTDPISGDATVTSVGVFAIVLAAWLQVMNVVRRLRDLGHAWFWLFISFVPIVGWVFGLYLLFAAGLPRQAYVGPRRAGVVPAPPVGAPVMSEREARAAHNEQFLNDDGSFDMDGLFRDSPIQRD